MIKFKLFNNFNIKKKIALIVLLLIALLLILGNYNREVIKSYISEGDTSLSIRLQIINIAKVAIPLKNLILMRNVEDKIALLKSSGSCVFCDFTQGNFEGNDLEGFDLRYANLSGANLINANLSGVNLNNSTYSLLGQLDTSLQYSNLSGANLTGVDLRNKDFTGTILTYANLTGAKLGTAYVSTTKNGQPIVLHLHDSLIRELVLANISFNIDGVDLSNKDLTGVNLTYAELRGANLTGVDLSNMDLTGANLTGVDLSNKDLTGTILTYANLTGANLTGVDLSNKDLTGTILKDVKKI